MPDAISGTAAVLGASGIGLSEAGASVPLIMMLCSVSVTDPSAATATGFGALTGLPNLFVSLPGPSTEARLALGTLVALTVIAAGAGIAGRGFGRGSGLLLVAAYAAYAVVALWLAG